MSLSSSKRTAPSKVVVCSGTDHEDGIEIELETREPSRLSSNNADGSRCGTAASDSLGDALYSKTALDDRPRNGDDPDSPTIVNNTNYPIVVFLARGVLYNGRVLHPGEALCLTRSQTGGFPYRVHAVIGDETALPKTTDSLKNLAKISAVPVAFVGGCLAAAAAAGTLAGPALALTPLVSGMVVNGIVIDTAALASGAVAADVAKKVSATLLKDHKEKLMGKTKVLLPGERYLSVTGGLQDGRIDIEVVPRVAFEQMEIAAIKVPEARS